MHFTIHCKKYIIVKLSRNEGVIFIAKANVDAMNEVYKELVGLIGYDDTMIIFNHFKGQQITFPIRLFRGEHVKETLQKEYDGTNSKELARQYGYSERWVKELIKKG